MLLVYLCRKLSAFIKRIVTRLLNHYITKTLITKVLKYFKRYNLLMGHPVDTNNLTRPKFVIIKINNIEEQIRVLSFEKWKTLKYHWRTKLPIFSGHRTTTLLFLFLNVNIYHQYNIIIYI